MSNAKRSNRCAHWALDSGGTTSPGTSLWARPVHHVRTGELDGYAAIGGGTVGSKKLWMGLVENEWYWSL